MNTKVLTISSPDEKEKIKEAAASLKEGKLVIFPTETVYGLGAKGTDEKAVSRIFEAKGRPSDNPLILHIAELDQIFPLIDTLPPHAEDVMEMFWPGPLTLIMKRSDIVPDSVTAGLDTVAIRMPSHPIARALLKEAKIPVAAPSANQSGRPSPTKIKHVLEDMMGKVDVIIDGGDTDWGIESTILDLTEEIPLILRPGGVTREDLETLIGAVRLDDDHSLEEGFVPKSPGQKYRHYAPQAEATLFAGNLTNVAKDVNRRIQNNPEKKIAVLATAETLDLYEGADLLINMGSREHLEEIAHNIFDSLRLCDEEKVDLIYVEGVDFEGLGTSIMNRLLKACSGKVVLSL